jgi:putative AlgH/UPF0301 family transcriptional regulator
LEGTKGIVVNMPSVMTISELCDQRGIEYPNHSERIYQGGPVAGDAVIMLHSDEWSSTNTTSAGAGYRMSSDYFMFEKLANFDCPAYYRIFAGIASWAPGQLELELNGDFPYTEKNSWLIADATDDILFATDGYEQWDVALDACSQQFFDRFI